MQRNNPILSTLLTLLCLLTGCADTEDPLTAEDVEQMIDAKLSAFNENVHNAIEGIYLTPQQIDNAVSDSIVSIHIKEKNGESTNGTGFVVRNGGYIATCAHVIEHIQTGTVNSIYDTHITYPIEAVLVVDDAHDIAIIKAAFSAPALVLGDNDAIHVGQFIYVIGNPRGWNGTLSEGVISGIRPNGFWKVKDEVIQITAPTSKGSSGSPVLNLNAEVIGIHYASDNTGQNLNFAIPSNYLEVLLSTIR